MTTPIVEVYGSIECPYAYLMHYRLTKLLPEYAGKLEIVWRALSLEHVNNAAPNMVGLLYEGTVLRMAEPQLKVSDWEHEDKFPPTTFLPAFEALACSQTQGQAAAFEMGWGLRTALYAESRNISMRHEIFAIAEHAAKKSPLNVEQFKKDWDSGKFRSIILAESTKGWHEIKVEGSATIVLPNGKQFSNPGIGEFEFDERKGEVSEYHPPKENWMETYRNILNAALS